MITIEIDEDLLPWIITSLSSCIDDGNDDMLILVDRQDLINDLENLFEDEDEDYDEY